ncbi:MAG: hypothetical protein ACLF0G_09645 [Candidatus Brocadiia bacterium]
MAQRRKADREDARESTPRLEDLKRLIRSGQYETEEKLEVALRRMLPDLRGLASGSGVSREDENADECP